MDHDRRTDVLDAVHGDAAAVTVCSPVAVDAGLSDAQVRAWVARSCAAQGLPVHVTDALVIERVRVLLTGTASPTSRPARP
jgi:hypothetical protein